jgi:small-conductance mechanosensitive channel
MKTRSQHTAGQRRASRHRFALGAGALAAVVWAGAALGADAADANQGGREPDLHRVARLNVGLPELATPPDLETPQASLENFMNSVDRGDPTRAAYSMNLSALDPSAQAREGPRLAQQLKSVIDQQVWFNWGDVPDRPDGQDDEAAIFRGNGPDDGRAPRSSLKLGSLFLGDRDVEIRLERVKPGDGPPVWVFSRQTVEHIPELHRHYGPNLIETSLPRWLRDTKIGRVAVWQWLGFVATLAAGGVLGWVVQKGINTVLRWTSSPWARTAAEAIRGPGALTIGLWVSHYLVRTFLGLAGPVLNVLEPLFAAVFVAGLVWFLHRLITVVSARLCERCEAVVHDDGNAMLTRITVLRHLLTFLVIVAGGVYALSRFEWFRQFGMTLLASAGVAGLILGIAAQRILGNLFAGFVLAMTQPVRAGDAILFEGTWGWIEEIAVTYLVIRSWDLRRVVVPITYFLDHPFQNWSRRSQQLMLPIFVYADYRVDVEAVRNEFKAALESSPDWDRSVPPILQVTGCDAETVELRGLCSASSPLASWNLQCHARERLVAFLKTFEGGRYLPRKRIAVVGDPAAAPPGSSHATTTPIPHPDGSNDALPEEALAGVGRDRH